MDQEIQELLQQIALENFFIKSSKGNYLAVTKNGDRWIAQGKEVKRQQDIEYLNKQYEDNLKDLTKTYNNLMDELQYGVWDSGNLTIGQNKILDYLLEKGIVVRTPGIPGEHDTVNGTAKWIYSLNEDSEDDAQHHRITNRKKSDAAKLAWKRHHQSYMAGTRKRERDMENKTFYSLAKELDSKVESVNEESIVRDNVFEKQLDLSFDTISGGISMGVKNGTISFSCTLEETGSGSYALEQGDEEALYKRIAPELQNICKMVDDEMRKLLAQNGLKSTK